MTHHSQYAVSGEEPCGSDASSADSRSGRSSRLRRGVLFIEEAEDMQSLDLT
jgi:hypothetical protein